MKIVKILLCLFLFLQVGFVHSKDVSEKAPVYLFWGKGCPHCKQAIAFLESLQKEIPNIEIQYLEIWDHPENLKLLKEFAQKGNFTYGGLPVIIIGDRHFVGYLSDSTSGQEIKQAILEWSQSKQLRAKGKERTQEYKPSPLPESIPVPLFGEVKIRNLSLPVLTIIIGAIDGFNPCAMWVLLMLLSFLIAMDDRKKMLYFGSLFIAASACVYYLFLVAWLNVMFFLRYIQGVKILIGILALVGGGYYLREFFKNKEGVCKVTKQEQKQKIASALSAIVSEKRYLLAGVGIVLLAFFVNLIELICSAGLPAIYTQILSITPLSKLEYYLYLLLYTFVFMLDDLIVFMIAIFSLKMMGITNKFSRYSHLIGGTVLAILGILLIFKPQWLMFD